MGNSSRDKIESVFDFLNKLKFIFERTFTNQYLYRGQSDCKWPLLPSIARIPNLPAETPNGWFGSSDELEGVPIILSWESLEENLLNQFKKYSIPYLQKIPDSYSEWLILAQHHGLPTRLLDWTTNPLKGLYYAVENPNCIEDGVVWIFSMGRICENLDEEIKSRRTKKGEKNFIIKYLPDHLNARIISQESCFTFFSFPEETKPMPPMEKIDQYSIEVEDLSQFIIPAESKQQIKRELGIFGITHRTLFPDLDNLCTSIRREFRLSW